MKAMNAYYMTKGYFKVAVLPACKFQLMNNDDRQAFAGAGNFCLIAYPEVEGNEFIVLAEHGTFQVFGFDEDGEQWCFSLLDDGEHGQFSQLF